MNKKWLAWLIVPVVAVGGYFGYNEWQTQLGQQALDATHLEFKPLDQAFAQAKASGKPVLADFSAIWCPTCRAMHSTVFTDATVKSVITDGYVLSRVDYESPESAAFQAKYGVRGFPTLLVLDADGNLLRQIPVSLDAATFAASLRRS